MIYTATKLREGWAIRPKGKGCGTCGFINGIGWTVQYVKHLPKGMEIERCE
jgi:hypothetical protein